MSMYHTPVPADSDPEENGPADYPDAVELPSDAGNHRLREAHLHNAQARTTALFASYFAGAGAGAAALVAWTMFGHVAFSLLGPWAGMVAVAFWLTWRRAIEQGNVAGSRSARIQPHWRPVVEAVGLAALWASLPTYAFPGLPLADQVVIAGAMGALIIAAIGLAAVPAAATAWISTMTLGLCVAYWHGSPEIDPKLAVTIIGVAAIAILGVGRLTRWTFDQLQEMARVRTQAESVRLLLREYEHRGVGWLWQVDSENRVVYISSRMTGLLGRSTSQLVGHSLPASLGGNSALGRTLLARQPFSNLEMELRTRRGARWISLAGDPIIDMGGQFQGFRGVGSDITEVRKTQERLTNLANMDVLSGLPNRGRVRQLLGEALSNAQATNVPCAIMFLDLDGFKPVNDTFGHPKGDAVLKSVAQRLVKEVGAAGHVGRMGGDEFAIVIKDAQGRKSVENIAQRLIDSVAEPYVIDQVEIRIGVSIGCAYGPIDGQSVDDLIQKADLALYQAKNEGRGTCCYFNSDMQSVAEHKMRLEQDLAAAIGSGQLRLLYQPLISAADQSLVGFEALIRWHHPTRGIVSPNDFIPLAEETGLIMQLGDWVIQEACRAAATWPENITVAVNLSARQLVMRALPATVSAALGKYRLPANRLELEVTETVFLEDSEGSLDVLKRLRALGVGIALDDFGTGYSSLGYLNKAVFHKLKIDGSFVREAANNKETVAIIQSIVQLAKSFRMTVTAEGVETADDFTRMRDLGCHQIQGYLFGRPMDYERASELVHGAQSRLTA
ncbi:putative bifunctional diguanylate cyclase/phosphodiesterase [Sphingosinicella sp. LY1275]|uniref:putative bifunctional diguanylate cyclase/phosphodiesterase n=1 Tax=Sphingosinicella sp. LY1275 TaxID=3095379 RepID=UPI002ADEAB33|nr:EAL domain-containing protein [Sphingosinicella sp. LY1275]MEA1013892.1 EAL domain-containing protein [Sphingosinicella sp. LY1275]